MRSNIEANERAASDDSQRQALSARYDAECRNVSRPAGPGGRSAPQNFFEELFGLQFVEILGEDRAAVAPTGKGGDIVWHDDVQVFSVWNDEGEGSGFVGYLYLDLFPREGKYGHAANFNLQPVCFVSTPG